MIKSFKRAISTVMALVFIISLLPIVSFAAGDAYPWIGSNKPTFRGYRATINEDGTVTKGTKIEGTSEHYNLVLNHPGNFGKLAKDTVYKEIRGIDAASDNSATSSFASGGADFTLSGIGDQTKDLVIEFSLCFENSSSIFSTFDGVQYFKVWDQGSYQGTGWYKNPSESFLHITSSKIKFAGGQSDYNFIPGRWYKFTLVSDFENTSDGSSTSYNYQAYVNGEKVVSSAYTNAVYGYRTFRMGSLSYDGDLWIDNINVYKIDDANTYTCADAKAPTLTSSSQDITIDTSIDTVVIDKNHKVSDLKAALSIDSNTSTVRYYNSDYSAQLSDGDSAVGANIVIATPRNYTIDGETVSLENTFTYFNANKWMYKYPNLNTGTQIFALRDDSAENESMESVNGNLGGKENDDYIKWCDSAGTIQRVIPISGASTAGKRDVLEMSIYVPSNSEGIHIRSFLSNVAGTGAGGSALWIKSDGIYSKWSQGDPGLICAFEPDQWHNIAIVTPAVYSDGSDPAESLLEVYVDGEKHTTNTINTLSGFRYLWPQCFAAGDLSPVIYFDNIRVHNGDYAPQYDVREEIGYKDGIDENNNIIVKGKTTVAQLKENITKKEDTVIRVYENISSTQILPDTAYVEDGYVVVAASMNDAELERTYSYYTIDKIKYEGNVTTLVNNNAAKLYSADDTLGVNAELYNYTDSDIYNATMYTAQYKYGELINVWVSDTKTIYAGEKADFSCNFEGIESLENTNIKVMLLSDSLKPYIKSETMRYMVGDTEATLYLLGDSIVQSYEGLGYPIQGWGYYLENYLNENITVDNRARSGWTTDHYLYPDSIYTKENGLYPVGTELLNLSGNKKIVGESDRFRTWDNIKTTLKAGDYVMIALGINDSGSGNVPVERYVENIETIYSEASSMGATVILMTPSITGRSWNDTASFRQEYIGRGQLCMEISARHDSVCLPFGAELIETYNAMVDEYLLENPDAELVDAKNYVRNYFHLYGESSTNPPPGWDDFGTKTTDDDMHYNFVGAQKAASVVAKLLAESDSPLGDYVVIPQ